MDHTRGILKHCGTGDDPKCIYQNRKCVLCVGRLFLFVEILLKRSLYDSLLQFATAEGVLCLQHLHRPRILLSSSEKVRQGIY